MIHVELQPEPAGFNEAVRGPGLRALTANLGALPPYWRSCLPALREAYRGICAYLCVLVPSGTGAKTVDHMAPKSKRRDLAYEWSNYRFVCALMNSRKRDLEDVLDPMEISNDWFILDLSALQVLPNPDLSPDVHSRVQMTIDRLRLNDTECRDARALYFDEYLKGHLSFRLLCEWSPFVAREWIRQGFSEIC